MTTKWYSRNHGSLKLPDICLIGEEKSRKYLTQETCPDRESNAGPLRERRACYRLLHSDGHIIIIIILIIIITIFLRNLGYGVDYVPIHFLRTCFLVQFVFSQN